MSSHRRSYVWGIVAAAVAASGLSQAACADSARITCRKTECRITCNGAKAKARCEGAGANMSAVCQCVADPRKPMGGSVYFRNWAGLKCGPRVCTGKTWPGGHTGTVGTSGKPICVCTGWK